MNFQRLFEYNCEDDFIKRIESIPGFAKSEVILDTWSFNEIYLCVWVVNKFQWYKHADTGITWIRSSFEEVLKESPIEMQETLLFNIDLFR